VKRRDFITLLGGAAAAWPLAARAQVTMVARIGFLRQAGPHEKQFNAFRDGLRAAGYVEGQNIVIEQRYAAGAYERLSGLASELVRANVDVIVVDGTAAAKACKDATPTIPVRSQPFHPHEAAPVTATAHDVSGDRGWVMRDMDGVQLQEHPSLLRCG
jgi:ABC transporter substrate binding protein